MNRLTPSTPQAPHPAVGGRASWAAVTQSGGLDETGLPVRPTRTGVPLVMRGNGDVQWSHPSLTQITLRAGSATGQRVWELLARPAGRDSAALAAEFARGVSRGSVFMLRAEDGWLFDIECSPLAAQPGTDWIGLCTSVAPEPAARVAEADILASLSDNLPISLVALSLPELNVVTINQQAREEFGLPGAANLPADLDEVFGEGLRPLLLPTLRDLLQGAPGGWGGLAAEHDLAWPGSQGARIVSARHVVVNGRDGTPSLVILLLRDISERRRAEIELLESELRFKELVEAIDDGVFVSTPLRERMLYTARRLGDLWGFSEEEMREDTSCFARRVHPQDLRLAPECAARELRHEPTDISFRINHPQRGLRWLRQRTRTRQLPNGQVRVYGVVSDVTEEREHALQLQAARDAAEAASEAKSQFMANMSHEIRTPMNGILGMTELLMGTALNERQRRFAQAVYRSAESLLEIINDILDFAKIEAGRLEVVSADFAPRTVVEDTLELLAPRAHEKGVELSFHEVGAGPAVVSGDALRLRQVLTNLVANAIKFTERGEVSVRLRTLGRPAGAVGAPAVGEAGVPVAEPGDGLRLEFEVRDSGIGIAPDVLPRLFSAFSQGHEGMSRRYGGTGLGLAISRQLVDLMGGRIEVESTPGVGSVFRFTVRVADTPAGAQPAATEQMPELRVLVVDDNETNRTVLEDLLARWGMHCTSAVDGQAALEILRDPAQGRFDLALVDGQMPRVDGLQFARRLREEGLQPQMKLMLLSSTALDDVRASLDSGYARFIAKPVRQAELRQAILGVNFGLAGEEAGVLPRFDASLLVVEDNPVNQEVIRQMLTTLGCQVSVAASAMSGLQALTERRYDLVLMDIQMPGMDGVEALRWFRGGRGNRFEFITPAHTPVVAVTANALSGDERRFLSLGFDDYLSKPFRQRQLVALLKRFLPVGDGAAPQRPQPLPPLERTLAAQDGQGASRADSDQTDPPNPRSPRSDLPTRPQEPGIVQQGSDMIDEQALQRLRELDPKGENRLLERVLEAFDNSVARLVPQLEEAAACGDLATVRHVAHTLKSSSASVGAGALSRLCAHVESGIREGRDIGDLGQCSAELCQELQRAQRALHERLGRVGAALP